MEFHTEVRFLIDRSIRRGTATWSEIAQVSEKHGEFTAEAVIDRLNSAGVHLANDQDLDVTPKTNVLLNDLTLAELVSICLQLPIAEKARRRSYRHVLRRRSYQLDLARLEYLDSDYEWYYLAPALNQLQRSIRRLFTSGQIPFAREWQESDNRTNLKYLQGLIAHQAFAAQILPRIRQHYLGLKPVKLLMSWIEAAGELAPTMADIIQAGLAKDGEDMVRRVLLSGQPSTAESALESRRDVCFSCPPWQRCRPLQDVGDPYRVLIDYRSTDLDALLGSRYPTKRLGDCLLEDGLIAKFFVPYSLVVTSKKFMMDIGLLNLFSVIARKNAGKYCPKVDRWFPTARGGRC